MNTTKMDTDQIAAEAAETYYKYEAAAWDIYLGHRDKLQAIINATIEKALDEDRKTYLQPSRAAHASEPLDAWPLLHEATKMLANYEAYDLEQRQDFYARVNLAESGKSRAAHAKCTCDHSASDIITDPYCPLYGQLRAAHASEEHEERQEGHPQEYGDSN